MRTERRGVAQTEVEVQFEHHKLQKSGVKLEESEHHTVVHIRRNLKGSRTKHRRQYQVTKQYIMRADNREEMERKRSEEGEEQKRR